MPVYLERYGIPQIPHDLHCHRCLWIRLGNQSLYRWEFQQYNKEFSVAVPGTITVDESVTGLSLIRHGAGLFYAPEPIHRPLIEAGETQLVLGDWACMGPGYHIYYSSRQRIPVGLHYLIELIREMRPLGF